MAKYTVFDSTNMGSTHYAERIFDAISDKDVENGTFGYLEKLEEGETVIYKFKPGKPSGTPKAGDFVVVDNPCLKYDAKRDIEQSRSNYVCEAGVPFRVRVVKKNDIFGISTEGITSATQTAIGANTDFVKTPFYLTIDTSGKLTAKNSTTSSEPFEAKVEYIDITTGVLARPKKSKVEPTKMYFARITTLA